MRGRTPIGILCKIAVIISNTTYTMICTVTDNSVVLPIDIENKLLSMMTEPEYISLLANTNVEINAALILRS